MMNQSQWKEWMRTGLHWTRLQGDLGLAVLLILLLPGCAMILPYYSGAAIRGGYEIPILEGTVETGYYRTLDVTVDYQYLKSHDTLQISGVVHFAERLRRNASRVGRFHLGVVFADADCRILSGHGLISASQVNSEDGLQFEGLVEVPRQSSFLAFTYSGQGRPGGEGGGGDEFWGFPVVKIRHPVE